MCSSDLKDLTPERLNEVVFKLLGDRELLIDMANASKSIGKPQAIDLIYDEIMKAYNEKQGSKNKKKEKIVEKEKSTEEPIKEIKTIGIKKK